MFPAGNGSRPPAEDGVFDESEVRLANLNPGLPPEMLALDVTPLGAHYRLSHFDVPLLDAASYRLRFEGAFEAPLSMALDEIQAEQRVTMPVTMECAGNGRAAMSPRPRSMPWMHEAVGTMEWTGTPLAPLIARARPASGVMDFAFEGADRGFDHGVLHAFGRSLTPDEVEGLDAILAYEANGQPLPPQHGAPLRLIVPGWYGMASVKWLMRIEALTRRYQGLQQAHNYRFRQSEEESGEPVTAMRIKSLMAPPGVPDWYTRSRWMEPGAVRIHGRAWSGEAPVERVEFGVDDDWMQATLDEAVGPHAWRGWHVDWDATPGRHVLACRATDAAGKRQPDAPAWNLSGFANNAVQKVEVVVGEEGND